jgi:hypothetical protein
VRGTSPCFQTFSSFPGNVGGDSKTTEGLHVESLLAKKSALSIPIPFDVGYPERSNSLTSQFYLEYFSYDSDTDCGRHGRISGFSTRNMNSSCVVNAAYQGLNHGLLSYSRDL